jgi:hypothetical protein
MPELRLPLSGDVTQTINPWTWLFRTVGNQLGLININLGKSSDPELEEQIVNEVGTYGKQLGQIGDALRILLKYNTPHDLEPDERRTLSALQFQLDEIDRLKTRRNQELARQRP